MRRLLKALPYSYVSYWPTPLSDYTHILDKGVVKGALVGQGYCDDLMSRALSLGQIS